MESRARAIVYWPGMNNDTLAVREHYSACKRVSTVTSSHARDGGPEFSSAATADFLTRWEVRHRMSSAYFPQSNGRAEVAVKKAKRMLMDNVDPTGSLNNDGLLRALLQVCNTPDPDCNISPAQVVFGRPIRDAFSFISRCIKYNNPSMRPTWRDAWSQKEDAMRVRMPCSTEALDMHTRPLAPLSHRSSTKYSFKTNVVHTLRNGTYRLPLWSWATTTNTG